MQERNEFYIGEDIICIFESMQNNVFTHGQQYEDRNKKYT